MVSHSSPLIFRSGCQLKKPKGLFSKMNVVSPSETSTKDVGPPTSMPLNNTPLEQGAEFQPGRKQPKRVLHFSDGTLEEFSTDEEDDVEPCSQKKSGSQVSSVNPATLTWMPWFIYQTVFVGNKTLAMCDFVGEYLASFFGITSPKYEYEIEHFKRMQAEENEKKKDDLELGGWIQQDTNVISSEQFRSAERSPSECPVSRWSHDIKKSCKVSWLR
ncbi:uncharacterized protein LOC106671061 isoform X2 [Cimex lectularius]|uniref:Protein FAM177A1 n=1 Tax=Cimex lectularius TaxID=79782 RepID=A0A8I6S6Z9_CIMLE|nr:uncharacterized protein LOC106671061 isoform X2 [Cimex lectularius]